MSHEDVMRLLKEKAELTAEVERLQRQSDNNIEAFNRVAEENERLRAELDSAPKYYVPVSVQEELEAEVEQRQGELDRVKMERDGFDVIAQHAEAEVERLQALYDRAYREGRDARAEAERLRAALEFMLDAFKNYQGKSPAYDEARAVLEEKE
jgi:regulator of replication initiation timing